MPPNKGTNRVTRSLVTFAGNVSVGVPPFEEVFLMKAYFMGENRLDRILYSLLHLLDVCVRYEHQGLTYLINRKNFERNVRNNYSRQISNHFKELSTAQGTRFNLLEFALKNGIKLDSICGTFPLKFRNFRFVAHSLRISYSLYLTFRMHGLGTLKFRQRTRGGVWKFENTNLFSKIFQHILSSVSKCKDELDLIKSLKNSLCFYVSDVMDQEEKPLNSFPLFPDGISSQIKKFFKDSPAKYSCFAFSCLQAKALCEEVPKEFIHASLQKHADQLSSDHRGISKETLELLEARGREFGKSVSKFYNPDAGFFPSNHASFEFPRGLGGVKGDLVFHDRLTQTPIGYYCDPDDRPEPFVIGLFGQPGMGKSVRINLLVSQLSKHFPGVSHKDLVYQRTCHVEHWDGYVGQPIVILDDLGQAADGDDIKEFQTLVSCCPYVLPMAHLEEKGRKFSSPVIITTSNLLYGGVLKNAYEDLIVIDDASFWRRFHLPLYVEKNQLYRLKEEPSWVRSWNLLIDTTRDRCGLLGVDSDQYFSQRTAFSETVPADSHVYSQGLWKLFPEKEISYISQLFEKRSYYHKNISHTWRQDRKSVV